MNSTDIFLAVSKRIVKDVRYFVEEKSVDVTLKDGEGRTLLHFCEPILFSV